jgi:phage terminase large subunit GpA-like protein
MTVYATGPGLLVRLCPRALIATADTQGTNDRDGYFWYTIRAWGLAYRSQLVDFGICSSKAELHQRCLERLIPVENGGGRAVAPQMLLVDSGGPRWDEIYEFAQSDNRIHPTKGASSRQMFMVEERPQRRHGIVLWLIDTNQAKDQLHRLIHDPDRTRWLVHNQVNADYCSQLCAESKVYNPAERREEWVEIVKNNNHIWDSEAMQCAAAWRLGMGTPEPAPVAQPPQQPPQRKPDRDNDWLGDMSAWRNR